MATGSAGVSAAAADSLAFSFLRLITEGALTPAWVRARLVATARAVLTAEMRNLRNSTLKSLSKFWSLAVVAISRPTAKSLAPVRTSPPLRSKTPACR